MSLRSYGRRGIPDVLRGDRYYTEAQIQLFMAVCFLVLSTVCK